MATVWCTHGVCTLALVFLVPRVPLAWSFPYFTTIVRIKSLIKNCPICKQHLMLFTYCNCSSFTLQDTLLFQQVPERRKSEMKGEQPSKCGAHATPIAQQACTCNSLPPILSLLQMWSLSSPVFDAVFHLCANISTLARNKICLFAGVFGQKLCKFFRSSWSIIDVRERE